MRQRRPEVKRGDEKMWEGRVFRALFRREVQGGEAAGTDGPPPEGAEDLRALARDGGRGGI